MGGGGEIMLTGNLYFKTTSHLRWKNFIVQIRMADFYAVKWQNLHNFLTLLKKGHVSVEPRYLGRVGKAQAYSRWSRISETLDSNNTQPNCMMVIEK